VLRHDAGRAGVPAASPQIGATLWERLGKRFWRNMSWRPNQDAP
jgi:hypothetical protein